MKIDDLVVTWSDLQFGWRNPGIFHRCFSKGTWLFGVFAMFSMGKSEVKALVGRTDCSGAEGIAAEDG